jgi:hypothetical protein
VAGQSMVRCPDKIPRLWLGSRTPDRPCVPVCFQHG